MKYRKKKEKITIKDFLVKMKYSRSYISNDILNLDRPAYILDRKVPDNLNEITFGQLCQLRHISSDQELIYMPLYILFNIRREIAEKCDAITALAFANWISKEVSRINKTFNSIQVKPTKEEIRAGIEKLNFGEFGIVDYYARRMGIQDHNTVMSLPWKRIFKCMEMDTKTNEYKKTLQKIIYSKK